MKIKKILSAVILSTMVISSSMCVFAEGEETYYGDGFEVADRVEIGAGKERSAMGKLGEGVLMVSPHTSTSKAIGYAITRTYNGNKYDLIAYVVCEDLLGNTEISPIASASNATSVVSGILSPKASYSGQFWGQHNITNQLTGDTEGLGTYSDMR
jgi:hypothetical protein